MELNDYSQRVWGIPYSQFVFIIDPFVKERWDHAALILGVKPPHIEDYVEGFDPEKNPSVGESYLNSMNYQIRIANPMGYVPLTTDKAGLDRAIFINNSHASSGGQTVIFDWNSGWGYRTDGANAYGPVPTSADNSTSVIMLNSNWTRVGYIQTQPDGTYVFITTGDPLPPGSVPAFWPPPAPAPTLVTQ